MQKAVNRKIGAGTQCEATLAGMRCEMLAGVDNHLKFRVDRTGLGLPRLIHECGRWYWIGSGETAEEIKRG